MLNDLCKIKCILSLIIPEKSARARALKTIFMNQFANFLDFMVCFWCRSSLITGYFSVNPLNHSKTCGLKRHSVLYSYFNMVSFCTIFPQFHKKKLEDYLIVPFELFDLFLQDNSTQTDCTIGDRYSKTDHCTTMRIELRAYIWFFYKFWIK